ncbi:MAG: hypothetical protein ABI844_03915 [Saprospiraceae bacterium]
MKYQNLKISFFIVLLGVAAINEGCKSKPVVIEEEQASTQEPNNTSTAESASAEPQVPMEIHEVKVEDLFSTKKYTYLNASENGKSFCVAIPYTDQVKKGKSYFYKGGLIMANFEKLPFKENYESVFIVPGVTETKEALYTLNPMGGGGASQNTTPVQVKLAHVPGEIKLADLIKNGDKYRGKLVLVHGECVKVNNGILNKNWIHIQDGTNDASGQKYDLTITTDAFVQIGDDLIFEGTIDLNKDFGAGYKYDIIMENSKKK